MPSCDTHDADMHVMCKHFILDDATKIVEPFLTTTDILANIANSSKIYSISHSSPRNISIADGNGSFTLQCKPFRKVTVICTYLYMLVR